MDAQTENNPSPDGTDPQKPATKAAMTFIFITVTLDILSSATIVPVLPQLIVDFVGEVGKGAEVYGLIGTLWALMQFIFSPVLGGLSDRFGRRPIVLLSNLGLALDYLIMALAPNLWWLVVGRILSGISSSSVPVANAYIADVLPPERRSAGFGMIGAAFGLGFVFGPALGGLLGAVDPRLPFWVAGGLSLTNFLYGYFILPESLAKNRRTPFRWRTANPLGALRLLRSHAGLFSLAIVAFLRFVAHTALPAVYVLYVDYRYHWDLQTLGLVLGAVGILSALVEGGLAARMVRKLGAPMTMFIGLGCGALGYLLMAVAPSGPIFMTALPLMAMWGVMRPAAQELMTARVGPTQQGQLQGALGSLNSVGGLIGPGLFTQAFALSISPLFGGEVPGLTFLVAALLLLIGFIPAVIGIRASARASGSSEPATGHG